ncbi:hypothetical protein [Mycobacterium neumannii]|uniref:hypothetical protein n=1 Tax=Mycobacterium neumannii TaxID=2048551 RepID=UPI003AB4BEE6
MTSSRPQLLVEAELLAENLSSLALEYQQIVRSAQQSADASHETAKRSLDRKFSKLAPREIVDELRKDGLTGAADRLDDLWKASAMVFNLVAVSVGVDEVEVLDIDIHGPHAAAVQALEQLSEG